MRLSFHDENSLEDAVGSLQFASDPIDTDAIGTIDTGIEVMNDIELVDRYTLTHSRHSYDRQI